MAHNSLIHGGVGSGFWPNGYVFTQLDMQTLDERQFQAINGDLGGAWAPSSPIIIGGSGLVLTSTLTATHADFSGGISVSATAFFNGQVIFQGGGVISTLGTTWQFFDSVRIAGAPGRIYFDAGSELTLHASSLITADCDADIGDGGAPHTWTWNPNMTAHFTGGASFEGSGHFGASSLYNYQGSSSYLSGSTIGLSDGSGYFVGKAARINREAKALNNADQSLAAADACYWKTPGLGANRTYSMVTTGAINGDEVDFYATNTTNDGILKDNLGNTLATLRQGTAGKDLSATIRYDGTNWILIRKYTQ